LSSNEEEEEDVFTIPVSDGFRGKMMQKMKYQIYLCMFVEVAKSKKETVIVCESTGCFRRERNKRRFFHVSIGWLKNLYFIYLYLYNVSRERERG
jgi:hypothetical protein